jgi:hypothetical protein
MLNVLETEYKGGRDARVRSQEPGARSHELVRVYRQPCYGPKGQDDLAPRLNGAKLMAVWDVFGPEGSN